jgi:tetratricopeptide (TPR) repeat protein
MSRMWRVCAGAVGLVGLLLSGVGAVAQSSSQSGQSGQSAPPAQQTDKDKAAAGSTLSLDVPAPAPNPEEDAAFKAFDALLLTDGDKKIKSGEEFAAKYPQSRYLPPVYSAMVKLYLQANQIQKMQDIGEKEVAISPNDVQTLAILAQTLPRSWSSSMPNAQQQLDKAEKFSKSAIELTPTLPKPDAMTDAQFAMAKNQTLAMAHSGLGLVYFRRGKFADAIPEFEQATKVDPDPQADPVNYYILGIANEKTSHFDDAVAAFTKCAGINSSLQATCKTGADEAKKLGATQLSAPK